MKSFRRLPMFTLESFRCPFDRANISSGGGVGGSGGGGGSIVAIEVSFEALAPVEAGEIAAWFVTIEQHPHFGAVKYIFEKGRAEKWQKVVGINVLPLDQEDIFLAWAIDIINTRKCPETT